jgi:hypothetical protein
MTSSASIPPNQVLNGQFLRRRFHPLRKLKNAIIACTLCATLILLTFSSASGFVFNVPKAKGVGGDPIKYSFRLGSGEKISFYFESRNATVIADFVEIAADNSIVNQTQIYGTSWKYEKSHPFPWTLNITVNASILYSGVGIDFYAKYTFIRTTGFILSVSVAITAAAMGIVCVYLLITKRKVEEKA